MSGRPTGGPDLRKRELTKMWRRMKKSDRAARALAEREATWRQRFDEQKEELDQARWQAQDGARKSREVDAKLRLDYASKLKDAADDAARSRADLERAFEEAQAKRDADRRVADEALLEARRDAESKLQESKVLVRKAEDPRVEAERSAEPAGDVRSWSSSCSANGGRDDDNRYVPRVSELYSRRPKHAFERSRDEASERRRSWNDD